MRRRPGRNIAAATAESLSNAPAALKTDERASRKPQAVRRQFRPTHRTTAAVRVLCTFS